MKINVVLVEPEIPQNTGNIARTCAATNIKLHLIHPLGFDISEKQVKRAGLDYWDKVEIEEHASLSAFFEKYPIKENNMFLLTTKGQKCYSEVDFSLLDKDVFVLFGKETKGLPEKLLIDNLDKAIRIPMKKDLRSLNLSNSVAIVVYEILRQINFGDLEETSVYLNDKYNL